MTCKCSLETINDVANEINAGVRDSRFDKVREIRFKSRFFFLLGFRRRPARFFRIFGFLLKIFCENGGRTSHLGQNLTENRLGAFLEPVRTSNSVVSHVQCPKTC